MCNCSGHYRSDMKAMTAASLKSAAPEIYFSLPQAHRGVIPFFLQLLLTIANKNT